MKTGFLKLITLLGYLGLLLIFTGLQWERFLSVRILLLVMTGTFCLSIPELFQKRDAVFSNVSSGIILLAGILEKQSISAGLLLSFLLLFSDNGQTGRSSEGIYQAALCFRPLFYGYCIHILLHAEEVLPEESIREKEEEEKENEKEVRKAEEIPIEEEYRRLRELGLTKRETEIARYLIHGRSNHEIAEMLTISEATVKKHISNIFQKLNIGRREQMAEVLFRKEN